MLQINNLTKFRVDTKSFTQVAKKILIGENRETVAAKAGSRRGGKHISLAFVSKEEIKKLNKKFRGKNKPTDVLSFSAQGGPASGWNLEDNYLGEIVICPEVVKEKKEDIIKVFIHGILHLLGYNHPATAGSRSRRDEKLEELGKIMEAKEEKYFNYV